LRMRCSSMAVSPEAAVEAALRHLEEQGLQSDVEPQSSELDGILREFVRRPEAILFTLCNVLGREPVPGTGPSSWRRIYSAMCILNQIAEAEPDLVAKVQRSIPSLAARLMHLGSDFDFSEDGRATLMVRHKAIALHDLLCSETFAGRAVRSRHLCTTDRLVGNLVRAHRDDDSTDSSPSRPASGYGDAPMPSAHVPTTAGGATASTASGSRAIPPDDAASPGTSCLPVSCGGALCGSGAAKPLRRSWGITPMACFFGMGERAGGDGQEQGSAAERLWLRLRAGGARSSRQCALGSVNGSLRQRC